MAVLETGRLGQLSDVEEYKLREVSLAFLIYFGDASNEAAVGGGPPSVESKTSGRLRLSERRTTETLIDNLPECVKIIKDISSEVKRDEMKQAWYSMIQQDHPDRLILRFLKACAWDTVKASEMLIRVLIWRASEHDIDEMMIRGEQFYIDVEPDVGFVNQFKKGSIMFHDKDKQGRPIIVFPVKNHDPKGQSEEAVERSIILVLETIRLCLTDNTETIVVLFDMTGFGLGNMDYHVVKFLIKCFQSYYPELLGNLFIHRAPWAFFTAWAVIKSWIDPVVGAKITFTKTEKDLLKFIDASSLAKDLGGNSTWQYEWIPPKEEENSLLKDTETRSKLLAERAELLADADSLNLKLITSSDEAERKAYFVERENLINSAKEHYFRIDPYIRSRIIADRDGSLGNFKVQFKRGEISNPTLSP